LDNARAGRHAVVVIDEAQLLDQAAALEVVRLLLNFEVEGRPAMTLLLVGQPSLLPVLDRHPALEERLSVKCLLRPLNLEETVSYVHHRLSAAGAERAIFDNDALTTLYHLSRGAPRQINRLCDLALLIGYADEQPSITAAQLEAVSDELVTVAPE
jgi:general secretion pathway protein A